MDIQFVPTSASWVNSFGTIDCGFELGRAAWPKLRHVFAVRRLHSSPSPDGVSFGPQPDVILPGPRPPRGLLSTHPVDLLVVERGHLRSASTLSYWWLALVDNASVSIRPKAIVEFWHQAVIGWKSGPMGKGIRSQWQSLGYFTRHLLLRAIDVGGAVTQDRLIVVRLQRTYATCWEWGLQTPCTSSRPMSNLLTIPAHLPRGRRLYFHPASITGSPRDASLEAMPDFPGALITTERGIRRLLHCELGRGLGIPKEWGVPDDSITGDDLLRSTSLFHYEFLSSSFAPPSSPPTVLPAISADFVACPEDTSDTGDSPPFDWKPPDLSVGSCWYATRLQNLQAACASYPDGADLFSSGLEMLRVHRGNYNSEGPDPKQLQLLWWEWPPEHWDALREGSRMNFLRPPDSVITPNSPMDDEQLQVAGAFVDELVDMKIIRPPPPGRPTLATTPLFLVIKAHIVSIGLWRVIADCKAGGQNSAVGIDPMILNRPRHILEQMYTGGYSAVTDASKFFYQFQTHPDDREFLGVVHPLTQEMFEWWGLPMGGGNCPSLSGRYGLSFIRMLKAKFSVFQGQPQANCWWTGFRSTGTYDPKLGHGYVLLGPGGEPAVLVFVHIDDFLLHGRTYEIVCKALHFFMDTAVDLGLLCHPKKTVPPQQVVEYCGFLFDTRDVPELVIPVPKRERGLAMAQYIALSPLGKAFSRLALSVVGGTLESLADATPSRLGHTKLRRFHSLIHADGGTGAEPYYTRCTVPLDVRKDLEWWIEFLHTANGYPARSSQSAVLVPTWGDGSGTGSGGTLQVPDVPMEMWMGQWQPFVFHHSSNWREFETLHLTMLQLTDRHADRLRGVTLFYFTDNSTVYNVCASRSSKAPALQTLIEKITLLELRLGCRLVVVHTPGVVMISQGTDGLSRGVWMSPLHTHMDPADINSAVFAPQPPDPCLVDYLTATYSLPPCWRFQDWNTVWDARALFHQFSVWFPPPELARQAIIFSLQAWTECPLTTSVLFIVPRILPAFWRGLSRHLTELVVLYPNEFPFLCPPVLPIPVVILYLPPYKRCLPLSPPSGMDTSSHATNRRWHEYQAEMVRRLPGTPLPK